MTNPRRSPRRALITAAAMAAALGCAVPAGAASATAPAGAVARFHTAGRVEASSGGYVAYSWPGVYFEGRFRGTGVGIVLDDSANDYDVQIDGATSATLVTPGTTTYWINGLTDTVHRVRLVKRTESTWAAGRFGGFVAAPGGAILPAPRTRHRQIEFIGDSYTAGYGNLSGTRDCSANGGVERNSDADLSFGALTAKSLGADYQINAYSGLGMVRNYDGGNTGVDFRTYYDRALIDVAGDVWNPPRDWRPQVVVVGLGINDFSTALHPGERWSTTESLVSAYESAYQGFIDKLRARYGPRTRIVVSATKASDTATFAQAAQQVVRDRNARGDERVGYWYYDDPSLDHLGCDWHPSAHDDRVISGLLDSYLATLRLDW